MKITISYTDAEKNAAAADLNALLHRHPGAKVKSSEKKPPHKHIYLSIKSEAVKKP